MKGRPDVWMPIYWGDFRRDTGHCTAAQRGAYMDLIGEYWQRGIPLPTDEGQLSRLARCTESEWASVRTVVLSFFYEKDGLWRHKRIDIELEKATARYEAKAEAGAKGAKKRWHSDSTTNGTANGTAIAEPMANGMAAECTLHTSHSPSERLPPIAPLQLFEDQVAAGKPRRKAKPTPVYSLDFQQFWTAFPNKVGKDYAWDVWQKIPDLAPVVEMVAAVQRYVATKPPDQNWCNPSTWLNQGRWKDEGPQKAKASSNPHHSTGSFKCPL